MSGEGQFREQAKKQWEKLDAEGCKIINDLLVADKDRTAWLENTVYREEGNKTDKSGIRHKKQAIHTCIRGKRRSTSRGSNQVRYPRLLHLLQLPPNKNKYVMIDAPNRQEPDTKYVVTAPFCHWIRERNITVSVLLSYTIRITHTARSNIQKAIKNTPSEEALEKKIAKQECYTELVEIILSAITDLSDVCDLNKDHETYIEKINGMINFMHERGVKPGCKTLTRETKYSDFTYAENDAETMNSARDIIYSKMNGDELVKQWKIKHDREVSAKNKAKQREIWEKRWGEFLTPHREQKDPETSSTISMGYNTTGTSTYTKEP